MAEDETKTDSSESEPSSSGKLEQGKDGVYTPVKQTKFSKSVKLSKAEQVRAKLNEVEEEFVGGFKKGMKLLKAVGDFLNE